MARNKDNQRLTPCLMKENDDCLEEIKIIQNIGKSTKTEGLVQHNLDEWSPVF